MYNLLFGNRVQHGVCLFVTAGLTIFIRVLNATTSLNRNVSRGVHATTKTQNADCLTIFMLLIIN